MPAGSTHHTYHSAKMERCIADLEAKGADPGKAHRICYASLGPEANKIEKSSDDQEPCPVCEGIQGYIESTKQRFVTKDTKRRYTLGIVYEPDELDTDNEFAKAEDIEAAAWDFMRSLQGRGTLAKAGLDLIEAMNKAEDKEIKIQLGDDVLKQIEKRGVNAMHIKELENSEVVESFIAPVDMMIGGDWVKKGSWLAGIIWDTESFQKIEDGTWTGYSMGGKARKVAHGD